MSTCRSCAHARPHDSSYQSIPTGDCDAPLPFWLVPHPVELDAQHECRAWKPKDLAAAHATSERGDDRA